MRWSSLVPFILSLLVMATPASAALVITEIMADPSTASDGNPVNTDEWFELYNSGTSRVNLGNIRFDDLPNASGGTQLSGSLVANGYAIVSRLTQANWQGKYGTLLSSTTYVQAPAWQSLNNTGDTLTLYDTVTASNIFSLTYPVTTNGASFQYTGTTAAGTQPYSALWKVSTVKTLVGGSLNDFHSAGSSSITAAPEPATMLLVGMSGLWVAGAVRRQRRQKGVVGA